MSRKGIIFNTLLNRKSFKKNNVKISPLALFDLKCEFEDNIFIDRFCSLHSAKVERFTYISQNCSADGCTIGRFCSIGSGVKIGLGKHPIDKTSTSPIFYSFKNRFGVKWSKDETVIESEHTQIGNDVWIGNNALIMGGISVGDGAIIAAGAVVTKDVEQYSIVAGVPAKEIKRRQSNEVIEKLKSIKWWNWDVQYIKENSDDFKNIGEFILKYYDKSM